MNEQDKEKLRAAGRQDLIDTYEIIISGYAGILPSGQIVDRREHPTAVPCQENPMFNTPKPKEL